MELKSIALICHIRNFLIKVILNNYVQLVVIFDIIQSKNLIELEKSLIVY